MTEDYPGQKYFHDTNPSIRRTKVTFKDRHGYFTDRNKKIESMVEGKANERQIGGSHYRSKDPDFQHWDLMAVNNVGYFPGQVTKYLARWREKNGIQDLDKSKHYLQKLIELHTDEVIPLPILRAMKGLDIYRDNHGMHLSEYRIFEIMLTYIDISELQEAMDLLIGLYEIK